jgi:hypothetical protein
MFLEDKKSILCLWYLEHKINVKEGAIKKHWAHNTNDEDIYQNCCSPTCKWTTPINMYITEQNRFGDKTKIQYKNVINW